MSFKNTTVNRVVLSATNLCANALYIGGVMMSNIQYITDDQGSQVGVILDMEDYRNLMAKPQADPDLLTYLRA